MNVNILIWSQILLWSAATIFLLFLCVFSLNVRIMPSSLDCDLNSYLKLLLKNHISCGKANSPESFQSISTEERTREKEDGSTQQVLHGGRWHGKNEFDRFYIRTLDDYLRTEDDGDNLRAHGEAWGLL